MARGETTFSNGLELGALGERLRAARHEQGATLDDLADRAGVSRSMVSDIERGAKVPTIIVLDRLAAALGVAIADLLAVERPARIAIRRRGEQERIGEPDGAVWRVLAPPEGARPDELRHLLLPPGVGTLPREGLPPGTRCTLAVEGGTLLLTVADETQPLAAGDHATFAADATHRLANTGTLPGSIYVLYHTGPPDDDE